MINISKFYYDHGSRDLATSYVQNHDFENSLDNKINFIGKNKQEKIDNAYYYFLDIAKQEIDQNIFFHLNEILSPVSLTDKDIKYSVKQQKSSLMRTLKLLQTYKFQNIEDEYKQLLASIDAKINSTAKSNTLLKLLREAELNDLTGNQNIGLYYIHIVNIIYGFFILKDRMTEYKKLLSMLKYGLQDIKDELYSFKIDNIISNLVSFHEAVDFDQIDRYVINYYYNYYVGKDIEFKSYKKLCSHLFDKNFQTLSKDSFDIDKINEPMKFLKFTNIVNFTTFYPWPDFTLHQILCKGDYQVD